MTPYDPEADDVDPTELPSTQLAQDNSEGQDETPLVPVSGIMKLPQEEIDLIVSYIKSKHDLFQLCKINRRFFAAAMPQLYRSITVAVEEVMEPIMLQMLIPENVGLKHIKEVTVIRKKDDNNRKTSNAHHGLAILINHIPQDKLQSFTFRATQPFPHRLLRILWKRQRTLQNVEVFARYMFPHTSRSAQRNEVDLWNVLEKTDFQCVTAVRIVLESPDDALLAGSILKYPGVTHLEVDGLLWAQGDAQANNDQHTGESINVEDPLTESLFTHVERVAPGRAANCNCFTSLVLKNINLTLCRRTWFTYLELSPLKHLRLEYCTGADIFLMQLEAGAATPGLQSLQVVHDIGKTADRTVHAIEEILSFPAHRVENLKLVLRNADRLPSLASIRNHSRSLKTLLIDVEFSSASESPSGQPGILAYSFSDFRSLVHSCSSLVELGVAFPRVGLDYEYGLEEEPGFGDYVKAAVSAANLATLNILNWPDIYTYGEKKGQYFTWNLQLARLASDIFRFSRRYDQATEGFVDSEHRPTLEVIAFGVREKNRAAIPPAYYVQCEIHILGKKALHAQQVDLQYLRDQALDIEILDYEERNFCQYSRKQNAIFNGWGSDSEYYDNDDEDDD